MRKEREREKSATEKREENEKTSTHHRRLLHGMAKRNEHSGTAIESEKNLLQDSAQHKCNTDEMTTVASAPCNGRGRNVFHFKVVHIFIFIYMQLVPRVSDTARNATRKKQQPFFLSVQGKKCATKTSDALKSDERASTMMMLMEGSQRKNGIVLIACRCSRLSRDSVMEYPPGRRNEKRTRKKKTERRRSESRKEGKMRSIKMLRENWLFTLVKRTTHRCCCCLFARARAST